MNLQQRQPQSHLDLLRRRIDEVQELLRATVPSNHVTAVLAILRVLAKLPTTPDSDAIPDPVTGRRRPLAVLGANKALQLCLETENSGSTVLPDAEADAWGAGFLDACGWLAEAEVVLAHCETGFMQMVNEGNETFHVWITTRRPPTSWRERADFDWWAGWSAERRCHEFEAIRSEMNMSALSGPERQTRARRLADIHLKRMAYQLGYPPDAVIDGCTVQTYGDVLRNLIEQVLNTGDIAQTARPLSERTLIAELALDLSIGAAVVARAVDAFTLDHDRAAYHAAVPGVAAAPLVRVDPDLLALSPFGLLTEPLLYLARELKRRAPQDYHNSAYLREDVFRRDLYGLFGDKRFVTSPGRIVLRRERGDARTDVDAVVFDRKTGTLGFFELKTQDPFARSTAELIRQRDNILYANRQVSGVLAWLQRYGPDELLNRAHTRTAKSFRVQKVYPFVVGRYLVHFNDGPEPDRRAAWGTWPEVLRLSDGEPPRLPGANPLASLFSRLTKAAPPLQLPANVPAKEIAIGQTRLLVYPSYAAYQARTGSLLSLL